MNLQLNSIYEGDALQVLTQMTDQSVHCIVTSPPYWNLRDYGVEGQLGMESTPEAYVENIVAVFREAKRVLRDEGTLWLNIGDSYMCNSGFTRATKSWKRSGTVDFKRSSPGVKTKDLVGIPWMVAFALRADGWYLRQDIIWSKPNPMPESVTDRCTKSHEYIFMLSKSPKYYYDSSAIRKPPAESTVKRMSQDVESQKGSNRVPGKTNGTMKAVMRSDKQRGHSRRHAGFNERWDQMSGEEQRAMGANKRSVWHVATKPFKEAHFATFPPELIIDCIKAGCPPKGIVLDPFFGSGTTGTVAAGLHRDWVGIELNPEYIRIAERRLHKTLGLFR